MQPGSNFAEELPKKRALLIGINYAPAQGTNSASTGSSGELKGPHVDVSKMKDLVMSGLSNFSCTTFVDAPNRRLSLLSR